VNQVPTGTDIPGLSGIPVFDFALTAEVLRTYHGWNPTNFARFQHMMTNYLYPVCHDFLDRHNDACISAYWANWDACNIGAIMAIGVLCDDTNKFNEAVNYFKTGAGMGSILNAVCHLHTPALGQWQESGRDQEHAQLGIGLLAAACEVAWHQGLDLYGYSNNRLLAGAEYVAQYNLWESVPYHYYNNCSNSKNYWPSMNGRGRLNDRPIWELIYNHYVVRQGLSAPNTTAMAQLMRPEHGSPDHFGYGTLTFTLDAAASPYPPSPIPPAPANLTATAGVSRVMLRWASSGNTVRGYNVQRSTSSGGPYTSIASWTDSTAPEYTDRSGVNGTTYYYVVAANNQSGTSANSTQAGATPVAAGALPGGWARKDIGTVTSAGGASYASVGSNTFIVSGNGTGIGGDRDSCSYAYMNRTGDFTFTGRLLVNGKIKTGLMMRETLDDNAKTLALTLGEAGLRGTRFRTRSSTGGSMSTQTGNDYVSAPVWYRLQRSGNTFTASHSPDGVMWFNVGSSTVTMAANYYVGLAVCGGAATFDNVTMTPPPKIENH
jgi:regulation of enolase protein 1 (concanavalin A-like superfamily)